MAVNGGNQTVPTLVYADGTRRPTRPWPRVKAKLAVLTGGLESPQRHSALEPSASRSEAFRTRR